MRQFPPAMKHGALPWAFCASLALMPACALDLLGSQHIKVKMVGSNEAASEAADGEDPVAESFLLQGIALIGEAEGEEVKIVSADEAMPVRIGQRNLRLLSYKIKDGLNKKTFTKLVLAFANQATAESLQGTSLAFNLENSSACQGSASDRELLNADADACVLTLEENFTINKGEDYVIQVIAKWGRSIALAAGSEKQSVEPPSFEIAIKQ